MSKRGSMRVVLALGLIGLAAIVSYALNRDVSALLLVLVAGSAAVLFAGVHSEPEPAPTPVFVADVPDAPTAELIEAIGEPILIVSGARVELANSAALVLLGEHITGQDVRLAIRHPAAAEQLVTAVGDGEPVPLLGLGARDQSWEMRVRSTGDGRRIVHLADRTGARAADRIRVDFVANASHELRTPLAAILGFIETLGDEAGEDATIRKRFLGVMDDEARRMQRLIDDLMSLSRIEAEKFRAPETPVDLADLAVEVHAELAATGDPRGGDLMLAAQDVPPVPGDRAQLSQLLHNLAANAMKYGRAGTPITIAIQPAGDNMVRLSVTDQGDGIPPEHLPRLTERFYRVDSGRSRAIGGTGLGLSIVKHIAERHRGRLDIVSVPGTGTTVTVLLPGALSQSRNSTATQGV